VIAPSPTIADGRGRSTVFATLFAAIAGLVTRHAIVAAEYLDPERA
jgi:hypothetical protein